MRPAAIWIAFLMILGSVLAVSCSGDDGDGGGAGDDDAVDDDDADDDDADDDADDDSAPQKSLEVYNDGWGDAEAMYVHDSFDDLNSGAFDVTYRIYWSDEGVSSDRANLSMSLYHREELKGAVQYVIEASVQLWQQGSERVIRAMNGSLSDWVVCAVPEFNRWYEIQVHVVPDGDDSASDSRYTVLIDDQPTPCANLRFWLDSGPLAALQFYTIGALERRSYELTYAYIDDIAITKDAEELFAEDWESYEVGDTPAEPWQYWSELSAYMKVVERSD